MPKTTNFLHTLTCGIFIVNVDCIQNNAMESLRRDIGYGLPRLLRSLAMTKCGGFRVGKASLSKRIFVS
ncbi:hypothetical protein [Helicobacter sp. MIT 05-5294]|uniref:hypothetical protein n=1 Tax=Helicobacter sp. MIT 05-5294 TaxID=1548150 RepID=UPI000A7E693C|nr:hypothetical protein [Helicobacter sp. MIT 05-5294]TLD86720.1 hypothetical protein LS69_005210 [Helicobacter sp. MIT 05-5294]